MSDKTELAVKGATGTLTVRTMDDLARLGNMLASSGYFKDARDAAQAGVKVLAGLEMGFGAFASMTGIHLIDGKPSVGANLLAQAVKRSGRYNYRVTKHTDQECVIAFFEHGEPIGESSFSMKDAQAAGVAGRGPWKAYPKAMLFARALSQGVRWHCPDVLGGTTAYVPEELGASVDGDGNVIDVESRPTRSAAAAAEPAPAVPAALEPEAEAKPAEAPLSVDDFADPVKPEPATIGKARAAAMSKALSGLGIGRKEHGRFASEATGRKVTDLADLTDDEARMVWAEAKSMEAA